MDKKKFWGLIEEVRQLETDDVAKMNEIAIDILSKCTVKDILGFQTVLGDIVMDISNNIRFIREVSNLGYVVTDDTLVYFTHWLVIRGEVYFKEVVHHPEVINQLNVSRLPENEELTCIGELAYAKRCELALHHHPSIDHDPDRLLLLTEMDFYDAMDKIGN